MAGRNSSAVEVLPGMTMAWIVGSTEDMLARYPIAFDGPHIYLHLRDLTDINNALGMALVYRTDDFADYQFY